MTIVYVPAYRYRFVELYYRRGETTHKGKTVPARVETVVIFLPDVWSCLPTRVEWEEVRQTYRKHLEKILKADAEPDVIDETDVTDEKALPLFFIYITSCMR